MRFRNPWDSEEEIAAATRAALESLGWEVHPECGGWDLLAVARNVKVATWGDVRPGDFLGVECKLDAGTKAGFESLARQALWMPRQDLDLSAYRWRIRERAPVPVLDFMRPRRGPHFRAVIAARVGLCHDLWRGHGIVEVEATTRVFTDRYGPPTGWRRKDAEQMAKSWNKEWGNPYHAPRREPQSLPTIPKVVVDVPAGVPSPQTSSPWKVAAVEAMMRLRSGDPMTSKQIRKLGINPRSLIDRGWVVDSGRREGRAYLWTAADPSDCREPPPDVQWPQIAEALERAGEVA